jgi:hypothetical protein
VGGLISSEGSGGIVPEAHVARYLHPRRMHHWRQRRQSREHELHIRPGEKEPLRGMGVGDRYSYEIVYLAGSWWSEYFGHYGQSHICVISTTTCLEDDTVPLQIGTQT